MPEARSKTFDRDFYGAVWEYPVFPPIGFLVFLVAGGAGGRQPEPFTISSLFSPLFRPSATASRIGLMESRVRCHCCCGGPPWLADPPAWLATPPRDGWLGRSAFALTKRTCFQCARVSVEDEGFFYVTCE